jgi:hypothetical protein
MARAVPTQAVQTIDYLFPHASKNARDALITIGQSSKLLGVLTTLKDVPDELIVLPAEEYADLVLAKSTIEETLSIWRSRDNGSGMAHVNGFDAVTVIRRALAKCPDEFPSTSVSLLFISDPALRDNIRADLSAVNRALSNAEWKAATVLAGATIEALLHWRLQQPSPGSAAISAAVNALVENGTIKIRPNSNLDRWELHHFIEVAHELRLLSPDTRDATRLAQNFRNLIHPGRAARLGQSCNRATALSAVGALEHVIADPLILAER